MPVMNVGSYSVTVFDRNLGAEPNQMTLNTNSDGLLNLNVAVEQGGMIVLTGQEKTETVSVMPETPTAFSSPGELQVP